jgi:hypothetical protein
MSLLSAVSEFCDNKAKLGDKPFSEAIDAYLASLVVVKRKDIARAVEDFITEQEPRTKPVNGNRPQISPKYHYNRAIMLRRFAGVFKNTAVSELSKNHLDTFFAGLSEISTKSRNRKKVMSAIYNLPATG